MSSRRRPTQTSLRSPATDGGKRAGSGRKPTGPRPGVRHRPRPRLTGRDPIHVTLRARADVARLRRRDGFRAIRWALAISLARGDDFRICYLSIQSNHLHLIVEASSREALAAGMKGFATSCARQLNRRRGRSGSVWADRYHARALTSPRQVRQGLAYVLNNWRRHGEAPARGALLDPYATGFHFDGWTAEPPRLRLRADAEVLPVVFPTSWLLTTGWRRHGRIDLRERPGPRPSELSSI